MFPVDAKIKTKVTNSLHLSITNLFHQFDNRIGSGRVVEVDEEREREGDSGIEHVDDVSRLDEVE